MSGELSLSDIRAALPIFEQINELYVSAYNLNQDAVAARAAAEQEQAKWVKRWPIISFFTVLPILEVILNVFLFIISTLFSWLPFLTVIVGAAAIVGMVGVFGGYIYIYRKGKQRLAAPKPTLPAELECQQKLEGISQEIYQITLNNQEIIERFPRDYRYYDAAVFFERVLENGQADSMKEAINLFEEYLHRQRLEESNLRVLEQAQMQSQMLSSIVADTRRTARNTGAELMFSVLHYLGS